MSEDAKKMILMKANQKFEFSVADIGVHGPKIRAKQINI